MGITRAGELLWAIPGGVGPFTGELLPDDHLCNRPEIIRALHEVLSAPPAASKKQAPRNAGKPWTQVEVDKLKDEFDAGMKPSEIAKEHGRSRGAIESRLVELGKMTRTYFGRKPK